MRNKSSGVLGTIVEQLDSLTEELKEIGVQYVGHGVVSVEGNHTGYFSNREWQGIYLSGKFFHAEPILDQFLKNPFDKVHWKYVENNNVAQLRKEMTGVVNGVTLCNFHNSFFGFLNIGFPDDRDTEKFLKDNLPIISAYHNVYDQMHLAWRAFALSETVQKKMTFLSV